MATTLRKLPQPYRNKKLPFKWRFSRRSVPPRTACERTALVHAANATLITRAKYPKRCGLFRSVHWTSNFQPQDSASGAAISKQLYPPGWSRLPHIRATGRRRRRHGMCCLPTRGLPHAAAPNCDDDGNPPSQRTTLPVLVFRVAIYDADYGPRSREWQLRGS